MISVSTQEAIMHILAHIREEDMEEVFHSRNGKWSEDEVLIELLDCQGFCLVSYAKDGEPVGMGGINHNQEQPFAVAWAMGTERFNERRLEITRSCKRACEAYRSIYPGRPILAYSWDEHERSAKWLKSIGFKELYPVSINEQPFTVYGMGVQ